MPYWSTQSQVCASSCCCSSVRSSTVFASPDFDHILQGVTARRGRTFCLQGFLADPAFSKRGRCGVRWVRALGSRRKTAEVGAKTDSLYRRLLATVLRAEMEMNNFLHPSAARSPWLYMLVPAPTAVDCPEPRLHIFGI